MAGSMEANCYGRSNGNCCAPGATCFLTENGTTGKCYLAVAARVAVIMEARLALVKYVLSHVVRDCATVLMEWVDVINLVTLIHIRSTKCDNKY